MTSKEIFDQIMVNVNEFEINGQDWCDNGTVVSAAKARSYSKKLISGLRAFVDASLAEELEIERAAQLAAAQAPPVEPPVEPQG